VRGSSPGGWSELPMANREVAGVEVRGGGGVRGSGRWVEERKCRMEWSRVGEAQE
jgi:hypothetical protein